MESRVVVFDPTIADVPILIRRRCRYDTTYLNPGDQVHGIKPAVRREMIEAGVAEVVPPNEIRTLI